MIHIELVLLHGIMEGLWANKLEVGCISPILPCTSKGRVSTRCLLPLTVEIGKKDSIHLIKLGLGEPRKLFHLCVITS